MAGPGLPATSHPGGTPASTRDRGAARIREHVT